MPRKRRSSLIHSNLTIDIVDVELVRVVVHGDVGDAVEARLRSHWNLEGKHFHQSRIFNLSLTRFYHYVKVVESINIGYTLMQWIKKTLNAFPPIFPFHIPYPYPTLAQPFAPHSPPCTVSCRRRRSLLDWRSCPARTYIIDLSIDILDILSPFCHITNSFSYLLHS